LLAALGLAALRARSGQLLLANVGEYLSALIAAGVHTSCGAVLLVARVTGEGLAWVGWASYALRVGCGVLLTVPLILIFGALFMSADAIFQQLVTDLFRWDVPDLLSHLALISCFSWTSGGLLQRALIVQDGPQSETTSAAASLGVIEMTMVLSALNVLFLAFVLVQFRYFFGGAAFVTVSPTLTYAEYARRGFFELVYVMALALPLLLLLHALVRPGDARQERIYRVLALGLVVMLMIVMASAVQRMRLYQDAFGMTELRLYTTAFMVWLGALLLWFVATVWRGHRRRFAVGALAAGFVLVAILDALNPDALIVRVNTARRDAPQPLDSAYLTGLSADAVPALVASLPLMSDGDRHRVASYLLRRWSSPPASDWRSWNWARSTAVDAVQANQALLGQAAWP
jgi:hypothetical protein